MYICTLLFLTKSWSMDKLLFMNLAEKKPVRILSSNGSAENVNVKSHKLFIIKKC
jgi:hypothetical protein